MATKFTRTLPANLPRGITNNRSTPGEVFTREAALRTVNSNDRSVEVVATTEDPALVWDWMTGRVILEVLMMSGGQWEDQTPLLRDHNQYTITAIVGSFLKPRAVQDRLEGIIQIGKDLDDTTEGIWRRVEQGHLRRVSVGYDYTRNDYVTIPAGETRSVQGRSFTAPPDRDLRVVFRWFLRELSLVVIPADSRAQLKQAEQDRRGTNATGSANLQASGDDQQSIARTSEVEKSMKRFIAFLHKCGLAETITDVSQAIAWARSGNLFADQITEAVKFAQEDGIDFTAEGCEPKRAAPATTGTRAASATVEPINDNPGIRGAGNSAETVDLGELSRQAAEQALAAERARIQQIRTLGAQHEIAANVIDTSIDAGHSIDQARAAFLEAMRTSRAAGAPAIHSRSSLSGAAGIRMLQAAALLRGGIEPDHAVWNAQATNTLASRRDLNIGWGCHHGGRGQRFDELCSMYDQVRQAGLHNASMMRLAQELVEMETGQRAPYNQDEMLQRAFSSANFSAIFGATVHLMMWAGYASAPATYERFCSIEDVPDFRDNSEAMVGEVGRLKKQSKTAPGQAPTLNMTDPVLAKLAADRYCGMLKITEQNFINDTFGAVGQTPIKLGQAVRAFIADLIWAQLLSTGNLADGRARFNTTDGNLIASGGAATVDGMTVAERMLRAVKVGDRRVQLGRSVYITGLTLGPRFRVLSGTTQLVTADNPFAGTFELVEDTAVDIGVSDPSTDPETVIAGRPNSYFILTQDGNAMKVVFRTGTNRGPITRTTQLTQGEWGLAWDVYVDMGAAFMRRTGAVEVRT